MIELEEKEESEEATSKSAAGLPPQSPL